MQRFYLYLLGILAVLLVGIAGYYYFLQKSDFIRIVNNDPTTTLILSDQKEIDRLLQEWSIRGGDEYFVYEPDLVGYSKRKISNILIQVEPNELEKGFINDEIGRKTFSYTHRFVDTSLVLLIHFDREYYDSPVVANKKFHTVTSGILNLLFTIFRPSPLFNRQQIIDQLRANSEHFLARDPIFVYE